MNKILYLTIALTTAIIFGCDSKKEDDFEFEVSPIEINPIEDILEPGGIAGIVVASDFDIDNLVGMTIKEVKEHPDCNCFHEPLENQKYRTPVSMRETEELIAWANVDKSATIINLSYISSSEEKDKVKELLPQK